MFPVYKIMSSANWDSLTCFFPTCVCFICLIVQARISRTTLNKSYGGKCPYLVPDHTGNALSF